MIRSLRRVTDRRRQVNGQYGWLFNPYTGDELIAIDCETTGLDPRNAELVSLAAVCVKGDRVLTSFALDLHLQRPIGLTGESIKIHGLRGIDLDGGEALDVALEKLLDFIGNRPLLGWCVDFDRAVINRHLRPRFGFDLPNACVDMAQEYRRELRHVSPQLGHSPSFEALASILGVPLIGRHTALGDAVTTALMYVRLKQGALEAS